MKKIFCAAALTLAAGLVPLYAEGKFDAGDYLKKNVYEAKLSNGITVQLLDRGYAPTLAMIISFNVGASDENSESIGIAHMLEHMLFKGTEKIGSRDYPKEKKLIEKIEALGETIDALEQSNPGSSVLPQMHLQLEALQKEHNKYFELNPYGRIYASMGGVNFNAFTSKDMTAYHIELPSSELPQWAEIEADRIAHPVFRQFYHERGAVIQERLMRYDSEGPSNLQEKFGAAAFLSHPYRVPVIGWESSVRHMSFTKMRQFYAEHYVPSAMNITIVGKQDVKQTLALLEKTFGAIPASPAVKRNVAPEPAQNGERRVAVEFDAKPYILIGWHKPTLPSKDDYVCDVISYLLTDGRNSRLYRSLVLDQKIVSSVDSGNGFPGARYDNLFVIDAEPKDGVSSQDVEAAIYKEIENLKTSVSQEDIDRVKRKIRAEKIFKLDSNLGLAREINYFATLIGDWSYEAEYLRNVSTVTPDEVKAALEKYFTAQNRTVGVLIPRQAKKGE